jgi:hypothetical protein
MQQRFVGLMCLLGDLCFKVRFQTCHWRMICSHTFRR